jgi:hypothetical protein
MVEWLSGLKELGIRVVEWLNSLKELGLLNS